MASPLTSNNEEGRGTGYNENHFSWRTWDTVASGGSSGGDHGSDQQQHYQWDLDYHALKQQVQTIKRIELLTEQEDEREKQEQTVRGRSIRHHEGDDEGSRRKEKARRRLAMAMLDLTRTLDDEIGE